MATSSSAADVVAAFIAAFEALDLEGLLSYVTDDVEYDNVPVGAVHSRDEMRTLLAPFMERCTKLRFIVHHQAAEGDVVMNERTDHFEFGDRQADAKVAGLFVIRDGKIALWRDYFDMGDFQKIQDAIGT
jgi:limonene-1,2-epoxide hydrolase